MFHASLVAQTGRNLPSMWDTWIRSLGWEDPLEEDMATTSSVLAWRSPMDGEPGGLQSMGYKQSDNSEQLGTVGGSQRALL